ncbi:hypothetical protein K7432_004520 [Basidiobolus ranarum]
MQEKTESTTKKAVSIGISNAEVEKKDISPKVTVAINNAEVCESSPTNSDLESSESDLADEIQKLTLGGDESLTRKEPIPLEPAAIKKVEETLNSSATVVVEAFNVVIYRDDILRLRDRQWLNDELVNFYGTLIMERAKSQPDKYPSVHFFNTFFYPLLLEHGYAKVQRWTRRVDLFSKELVIVPIHLGAHWCCAIINIKLKRIEYYDPLLSNNPQCLKALQAYLNDEAKSKKELVLDSSEWTSYTPKDIPRQENGYDCGVFSCQYAEYISRNSPLNFSQRHMVQFRKQMVYEIVTTKLIN